MPTLNSLEILDCGRQAIAVEAQALQMLGKRLDQSFVEAVQMLAGCRGKVVLTGIGKSGIICRKIAATLASTGTPALFLHPTEGLHGDLGVLSLEDMIIAVSYSGITEELIKIIPSLKRQGLSLLTLTGNLSSELARCSDLALDISIDQEACPLGLAPTASTTVTLALGDALAAALLAVKGFKAEDFALRHPGGALGRRLLLKVSDIMHTGDKIPYISERITLREALFEMTGKGLGVTGFFDSNGMLSGVLTDGDLRRLFSSFSNPLELPVYNVMTRNPKTISPEALAASALKMMEQSKITSLFVEETGSVIGIIHLHDLLKAGIL
jgi:arabinose-5-phosphate isomerase